MTKIKQHTTWLCLFVFSTDGSENIFKVQSALEAVCLTLLCVIRLTLSRSHTLTRWEADWHNDMFIEKLWIIEKVAAAAGMSQPLTKGQKKQNKNKTDMKSLI